MPFRLLALLWFLGTVWIWLTRVPVPPTWSLQHRESVRTAVITRQRELALVLYRLGWIEQDGPVCRGPIEFWSLAERKKVREVFGNGDEILTPQIPAHGVAIIRREGELYAASAFSGELLCRLPGKWSTTPAVINSTGTQLLRGDDQSVRLYDLTTGRELWKLPHYGYQLSFGPDFVVVDVFKERDGVYDSRIEILNRETGAPDHRFRHLGHLHEVHAFDDSRYVVIYAAKSWTICDARSGRVLWSLPNGGQFERFRFDEQDTVLCSDAADNRGNVMVVRWRASDGTLLSPLPSGSSFFARRQSAPDGRYVVDSAIAPHPRFLPHIQFMLARLARLMTGVNWNRRSGRGFYYSCRVQDTKWGISFPLLASPEQPQLAHDGSGCTFVRMNRVECYDFPPGRNWAWLAGWGVTPLLVVRGLVELRGIRRKPKATADEGDATKRGIHHHEIAGVNSATRAGRRPVDPGKEAGVVRWRLGALIWFFAVLMFWREYVPLKPTRTVRFSEPTRIGGFNEAGELRLTRLRPPSFPRTAPPFRGPVEFWRLPEVEKVGEIFKESDFLYESAALPGDISVVERAQATRVMSDLTGEVLGELPRTGRLLHPRTFANNTRLIYSDGDTLRAYDLQEKRELWAAQGYIYTNGFGPDFVVSTHAVPEGVGVLTGPQGATTTVFVITGGGAQGLFSGSGVAVLNLETGQLDQRFDYLGNLLRLTPSLDGRFALASVTNGPHVMCDARTGKTLWTLQRTRRWQPSPAGSISPAMSSVPTSNGGLVRS